MSAAAAFAVWLEARLHGLDAALASVRAARQGDPSAGRLLRAWLHESGLDAAVEAAGAAADTVASAEPGPSRAEVVAALHRLIDGAGVAAPQLARARMCDLSEDSVGVVWHLHRCGYWRARDLVLTGDDLAAARVLSRFGRGEPPTSPDAPLLQRGPSDPRPWSLRMLRHLGRRAASGS